MGVRGALIVAMFVALYGAVIFNLYNLQIQKGTFYSAKAESQLALAGILEPVRGNVYFTDKQGDRIPAAMNKDFPFVYAVPKEIDDADEAAEAIAPIIGKERSELKKIFSNKEDLYEPLLQKATDEQVKLLADVQVKGIYTENQPARFYPLGDVGSQVIGFVSTAGAKDARPIGQYGIERFYEDALQGTEGSLEGDVVEPSEPGKEIHLTIDRNIQDRAGGIMAKLIGEYGAERASFIVEETKTGKILAIGGIPAFNPNTYSSSAIKDFLNPTVQEVYEPGSIFKVITMAAGIDSGAITPETTYVDTGSLTMNGKTIRNWDLEAHGLMTMTNVIEKSLNTGAAFAERKTGHKAFHNYLVKFGFKETKGIDLPGERVGSLAPIETKNVRDINFATASYGQGISVTPLALIQAVSAIANGGALMRPYVNDDFEPMKVRQVIAKETGKKVTAMMVSAVDKAVITHIPGYSVAGKTGTAYIPDFNKGGYTSEVINTYVGFAPASDPQFTILLRLDKPVGAPVAGLTVVPAFRELSEFILNYLNIPPDRPGTN